MGKGCIKLCDWLVSFGDIFIELNILGDKLLLGEKIFNFVSLLSCRVPQEDAGNKFRAELVLVYVWVVNHGNAPKGPKLRVVRQLLKHHFIRCMSYDLRH